MSKSKRTANQVATRKKRSPRTAEMPKQKTKRDKKKSQTPTQGRTPAVREGSKIAEIVAMLRGADGATIDALSKATGWQEHSVRGALSGALKKKFGLTVTSVKADGVRTYHIST